MQPTIPADEILPPGVISAALRKSAQDGDDYEETGIGGAQAEAFNRHESGEVAVMSVAKGQLRAFIERIERLEEEKKSIADDIKDVYGEAKSQGFDTKQIKKVIALRKKDDEERKQEDLILDTYLNAMGMI